MSEDIYTKFGIDKSRLKRDYQKEPIKITKNGRGSEYLSKEELEYLFIELNLSVYQIKNIIKVSNHRCIERWLLKNNIKKSPQLWTHRDVLKRETAIKNNINYLEFFNMNQFNDWFNAQKNKWLRGGTHLTILNFNINER